MDLNKTWREAKKMVQDLTSALDLAQKDLASGLHPEVAWAIQEQICDLLLALEEAAKEESVARRELEDALRKMGKL